MNPSRESMHGLDTLSQEEKESERVRLTRQLSQITEEILSTQLRLRDARQNERANNVTGISETSDGEPLGSLSVRVIQVRGLQNEIDAFVLVKISPKDACDGTAERRTKTKRRSRAPSWDTTFEFAPINRMPGVVVELSLNAGGKSSKSKRMGDVRIPLEDLSAQHSTCDWRELRLTGAASPRSRQRSEPPGTVELQVELAFTHSPAGKVGDELGVLRRRKEVIDERLRALNNLIDVHDNAQRLAVQTKTAAIPEEPDTENESMGTQCVESVPNDDVPELFLPNHAHVYRSLMAKVEALRERGPIAPRNFLTAENVRATFIEAVRTTLPPENVPLYNEMLQKRKNKSSSTTGPGAKGISAVQPVQERPPLPLVPEAIEAEMRAASMARYASRSAKRSAPKPPTAKVVWR